MGLEKYQNEQNDYFKVRELLFGRNESEHYIDDDINQTEIFYDIKQPMILLIFKKLLVENDVILTELDKIKIGYMK